MIKMISYFRWAISLLVFSALSACGTSLSVQASHRLQNDFPKAQQMVFVYRTSDLKTIGTSSGGGTWRGETGFYEFGPIIASQASHILSSYGVKIIKASNIESTDAIFSEETLGSRAEGKPLLLIYAENSRVMSDINGSIVRFLFTAKLVDTKTKNIIWTASIDTRTIAGRSIVGKAMTGDFDQKFANDILGAVAARMKKDGLI